jgi:hypothetical protein
MNHMLKRFFSLVLLVSPALVIADSSSTSSTHAYFSIRSQSVNAALELAGWQTHINLYDRDCFYWSFYIAPEYKQSFNPRGIANFLFGPDLVTTATTVVTSAVPPFTSTSSASNTSALVISGSGVGIPVSGLLTTPISRGVHDWLADYFGLPQDFQSVVTFSPRITNALADFNVYLGLDEWATGLYFRIHAPVVHTRWELRAAENVINPGTFSYTPGYMAPTGVPNSSLRHSFLSALDGTYTFGDMTDPLKFGKIATSSTTTGTGTQSSRQSKTRLSDIEAALGWNFWQCEDYHLGVQIRGSAPTGTRPNGEYLFEPTIGNGHHWMLGGGISSHAILWRGCDEDRYFGVWMDVNIEHLFKTRQTRSFDFVGKPNSRYVLLEEFTSAVSQGLVSGTTAGVASTVTPLMPNGATAPSAQYAGILHPAINITTLDVNVSIAVQTDFVLKFAYISGGFQADLGYNLWARSGEKFSPTTDPIITEKKYAIKGDAQIYGFSTGSTGAANAVNAPVRLSATENSATINGGTNFVNGVTLATGQLNLNVDNAQFAFDGPNLQNYLSFTTPTPLGNASVNIKTSNPPIFVKSTDIDLSDTPSALTHKVFGHIGYNWEDCDDWVPFLGIGAEGEFNGKGGNGNNGTNNRNASLSQWGVWVKGGISFN